MAISFDSVPQTKVPLVSVEFTNRFANQGLSALNYKILLIGQGTDAGNGTANVLTRLAAGNVADDAKAKYGAGSQLHLMAKGIKAINDTSEVYAVATALDAVATPTNKATQTVTITGTSTAAGNIYLYIDGQRIVTAIASGTSATDAADDVLAEIALNHPHLSVVGANVGGVITFTARNIGIQGNFVDTRLNYNAGEATVAGLSIAVGTASGGASTPSVTSAIAALGDEWFQIIGFPYATSGDATLMTEINTELERRFGPTTQIDGVGFTASADTHANLLTLGGVNKTRKQFSVVAATGLATSLSYYIGTIVGAVGKHLSTGNGAESKPITNILLPGVLGPASGDKFTFTEKDQLLKNGIATFYQTDSGDVYVERLATTWHENSQGVSDYSYADSEPRYTLMYLRWSFRNRILSKHSQSKLANDGTRFAAGQQVITPSIGKAEAVAIFREWEALGLVEDFDQFKNDLICERNATDVNRLDWFLGPNLVNQFRVGGVQIGFLL